MAIEAAKAQERMLAGKAQDPMENSPQGKTREIVAEALGTSSNTIAREQFIEDHRDLLDPADFADTRIGELLRELPTSKGGRPKNSSDVQEEFTKADAIADAGISKSQAYDLQAMATNPGVVEAVIAKAEQRRLDPLEFHSSGLLLESRMTRIWQFFGVFAGQLVPFRFRWRFRQVIQTKAGSANTCIYLRECLEPEMGIEPITAGLQVR